MQKNVNDYSPKEAWARAYDWPDTPWEQENRAALHRAAFVRCSVAIVLSLALFLWLVVA
jgi:hypothetical protein